MEGLWKVLIWNHWRSDFDVWRQRAWRHYVSGSSSLRPRRAAADRRCFYVSVSRCEDVIRDRKWKGYNESLRQYHGEVMHKPRLYSLFKQKISRCKSDTAAFEKADWSGLRAILLHMFSAFK